MEIKPEQILTQCPLCQTVYGQEGISLLGEHGAARLYHCSCQSCGHAMLAVVMEGGGLVSSVGMVTDLQAADAKRFRNQGVISTDECIKSHDLLENCSQDLCRRLISGRP